MDRDDNDLAGASAPVAIVGAGVAGCALALHLGACGHDVLLFDRDRYPREKVCGEGLMPNGVAELRSLGVLSALMEAGARPFTGISYHLGANVAKGRFPAPRREGLGVRRFHLDAALAEACSAHPRISLRTGVQVMGIEIGSEGVGVTTSEGRVTARVVVGADGLHSKVRRKLGLHQPTVGIHRYGARAHYRITGPPPDVVQVHVTEACEFYVTPSGPDAVNVTLLGPRELTRSFRGAIQGGFRSRVEAHPPLRELLRGSERLTTPQLAGPLRQQVSGIVADRAVLVGDAAGFVDAITGEGMSIALISARIAAQVLDDALGRDRLSRIDLLPYESRHARAVQEGTRLTEIVLWGLRQPRIAHRVVSNLRRHPDLFDTVLAVNAGQASLRDIGLRGLVRMLIG
jgi:flavin-dependent dehydrogenase